MARVVIVGGGFGGVVAAESLAKKLGVEHEITVVSRSPKFLFYPALVRLAFGDCEPDDIVFDLREAMLDRKVRFVEGDLFEADIGEATVVTLYLLTRLNEKLKPKLLKDLQPGTRVVSHAFDMGDWIPEQKAQVGASSVYLWRIPGRA